MTHYYTVADNLVTSRVGMTQETPIQYLCSPSDYYRGNITPEQKWDSVCSRPRRPLPFFTLSDFTEPHCDAAVWLAPSSVRNIHLTPDRCRGCLLFLLLCDSSWRIKERCFKEKSWHMHWWEKKQRAALFSTRHVHIHGGDLGERSVIWKATRGKWHWCRCIRLNGCPWKIGLLWAKHIVNSCRSPVALVVRCGMSTRISYNIFKMGLRADWIVEKLPEKRQTKWKENSPEKYAI